MRKGFGWFTRVLAWLILLSSFVVAAAAYTENETGLMIFTFVIFIVSVLMLSLSCFLFSRWNKRLILPFICVPLAAFITLALIVF